MQIIKKITILTIFLVILGLSNLYTHLETKKSHREVGYNNGTIATKYEIINRLREYIGEIPMCSKEQQKEENIFFSVKAHTVYFINKEKNKIAFCET